MKTTGIKSYIGTKEYYKHIFRVMLPILLQNLVTNFVNLLDNIMVGQVGTEPMSGVAIANQLVFIFNLCVFGGLAGSGIFTAQFYGKGDENGICQTVRMKLITTALLFVIFVTIFLTIGPNLLMSFLHGGSAELNTEATFGYSMDYLHVIMIQLLPFAVTQCYSTTLRECGETMVPMRASLIAVLVNLVGNYILIFGKFGAPELGVVGAAIATVISRFTECAILIIYSHSKKRRERFPFFSKVYKTFRIRKELAVTMIKKGTPLLVNELLWSGGMTMLNQCYSVRGLEVVSATNISSTIGNLFFCVAMAIGATITIVVGQHLGAGKLEEAILDVKKIIVLSEVLCIGIGIILYFLSPLFADFYNTTPLVKEMATYFLKIVAIFLPVHAFAHASYFTLRSGGKTIITFLFDSGYTWGIAVVLALILTRCTNLSIYTIYLIITSADLIKCVAGYIMMKSRIWVVNMVEGDVS